MLFCKSADFIQRGFCLRSRLVVPVIKYDPRHLNLMVIVFRPESFQ